MSHNLRTHSARRTARALTALTLSGGLVLGGAGLATAAGSLESLTGSLDAASVLLNPGSPSDGIGQLKSVVNFRDVAGVDGYKTADGERMATGVFYRSNQLVNPDEDDQAALAALGLDTVYDLRTDADIQLPFVGGEDTVPDGVAYKQIPIDSGNLLNDAPALKDADEAEDYMRDMYRDFVTNSDTRAAFGELLTDMAQAEGPVVFHCTSGKDRTGWAAMLLQHIAGASDETIMNDYLLSNEYSASSIEKTLAQVSAAGIDPDTLKPMLLVKNSYLVAGLDQAIADYGSIDAYIADGLGVDADTLAQLKDKLVA